MHLAAAIGLFSIPPLAFIFTPMGRSMVATAWAWLKGVFGKLTPRGILFVVRKKSHTGDELDILFSTHDAETISRLLQGSPTSLLKQLPGALGGECPTPPHVAANREPVQPLLPPQVMPSELLDSNESQSRSLSPAAPAKKHRTRPRAARPPQSSRRMGCGCRNDRSARVGKRR
jgi:hypothetical protein